MASWSFARPQFNHFACEFLNLHTFYRLQTFLRHLSKDMMSSYALTAETPDEMLNRITQTLPTGEEEVDEEHVSFQMFRSYEAHVPVGHSRRVPASYSRQCW